MESLDVRTNHLGVGQFGLVTRRQLAGTRVDPRTIRARLERGSWLEALPGVIDLQTHPLTWRKDQMRVLLAAGDGAVVSHQSAGFLHGLLDVPRPDRPHVTIPRGRHAVVGDVRLHTTTRLSAHDVTRVDGFPCTPVPRTFLDLGAVLPAADLEPPLWDAARRIPDLPAQLAAAILRHPKAPGRGEVERLVAALRPDIALAESPLEVYGILGLRRAGAPDPVLQYTIRDTAGRFVARTDAAWPDARTLVEFNGAAYHDGPIRSRFDAERLARLRELGWYAIVLRARDLNPRRLRRVAQEIRSRLP